MKVLRSECLYQDEIIGIESIYTVVNGKQINIPDKVEALREKGRAGLLLCPCGCRARLILVAGDRNLRQQHFRIMNGSSWKECTLKEEGQNSVDSKVVLKCWLDDKLQREVQTRVPISRIADTDRKYEVSHYVPDLRFALNYTNMRINLEDEKLDALEEVFGRNILYIVDIDNMQSFGQYPEFMNKIQKHQDFCLFLEIDGRDYDKARMVSAFYMKDLDGMYQRIEMTDELLKEYGFCGENDFLLTGRRLSKIYQEKKADFIAKQEEEKKRRIEEERRQKEALKKLREAKERRDRAMEVEDARRHARIAEELRQERLRKQQEAEQRKAEEEEEEKRKQQEQEQQQKDLGELAEKAAKEIGSYIDQPYYDQSGQRWFKCETCGKVATQIEFAEYGGKHRLARGTCRDCMKKRQDGPDFNETETARNYCPRCGCELVRRTGKNGPFWGCSAYPDCTFTKKITLF